MPVDETWGERRGAQLREGGAEHAGHGDEDFLKTVLPPREIEETEREREIQRHADGWRSVCGHAENMQRLSHANSS